MVCCILAATAFALPIGDPRSPDEHTLSLIDVPIEQGVHEIGLNVFLGASKIDYPDVGGTRFSPGFGAAFTYNFFFLPRWSFLIGGGIQLFNNRGTEVEPDFSSDKYGAIKDVSDAEYENMPNTDHITIYYDVEGYRETQWAMMLMVPVMFQYQTNETRNKALYYGIGAKVGFPFGGAFESKVDKARLCGYYPNLWGTPDEGFGFAQCNEGNPGLGEGVDGAESAGFGNFDGMTSYGKLKLGTAFFAAIEAGVKWRLYNKLAVYTGFWLDYAMNDVAIKSVSRATPFTWSPKEGYSEDHYTPKADVIFNSRAEGRAVPISAGFTFRIALGGGSRHETDTLRWIREIVYRDSLLNAMFDDRDKWAADSARVADSLVFMNAKVDILLDSLVECRRHCMTEIDREALNRKIDSLARLLESERQSYLEAQRLAALEKARQDSIAHRAKLDAEREARLAEFRKRLAAITNGLDDYKITQTLPSDNAREKLDLAAELMRDYPDLKIRLIGHTCDKGTHEANLRYGMQRAETARTYMTNVKGVAPERVEVGTKAEMEPVMPNTTEDNRRKNRRVQIEILEGAEITEEVK